MIYLEFLAKKHEVVQHVPSYQHVSAFCQIFEPLIINILCDKFENYSSVIVSSMLSNVVIIPKLWKLDIFMGIYDT